MCQPFPPALHSKAYLLAYTWYISFGSIFVLWLSLLLLLRPPLFVVRYSVGTREFSLRRTKIKRFGREKLCCRFFSRFTLCFRERMSSKQTRLRLSSQFCESQGNTREKNLLFSPAWKQNDYVRLCWFAFLVFFRPLCHVMITFYCR